MIKTEGTTIKIFRGDEGTLYISKKDKNGNIEKFKKDDKVVLSVKENFGEHEVKLRKEVVVQEESEKVGFTFYPEDTKFIDLISEPIDFEYDIDLNDGNTILGHDDSGAKIFRIYPTGSDDV